jgi:hypothetical protein
VQLVPSPVCLDQSARLDCDLSARCRRRAGTCWATAKAIDRSKGSAPVV